MIDVVTGGSGSGKSRYAEELTALGEPASKIYLATMMVWDEEGKKRVERHRRMRMDKGFATLERFTGLSGLKLEGRPTVLLECMSNLVSNEFFRLGELAFPEIQAGVGNLADQCGRLIIVTNEVFSDGTLYGEETEQYIRLLGQINCWLGRIARSVTEVVCGIPIRVK